MHAFPFEDHRGQDRRKYPLSRAIDFFEILKSTVERKIKYNTITPTFLAFAAANSIQIHTTYIGHSGYNKIFSLHIVHIYWYNIL